MNVHMKEPLPKVLLSKVFEHVDQLAFAAISQDWNPMHVDPVSARRFLSGAQVVHGINLLLTAVDMAAACDINLHAVARVACDFKIAVNLGEKVTFVLAENSADLAVIHAMLGSVICTKISLFFIPGFALGNDASPIEAKSKSRAEFLAAPIDLPEEEYEGFSAEICLGDCAAEGFEMNYPHMASNYGKFFCAAFSRLSYVVGMMCPGLNSIFLSLDVRINERWRTEQSLKFRVSKYEDRIKLLELSLESGFLTGKIHAFRRPVPVEQPDMAEVESYVGADEFKHVHSLVIGGSRGLGALTGKILCAGGGKVIIGYAVGETDALKVKNDIEKSRPNACRILRFDIKDRISDLVDSIGEIDSVYYFPTPQIFKKVNTVFDRQIFENLLEYYVFAFYRLCEQLEKDARNAVKIYYPSSVAIDERPNGMTEYAMAKAAAELMIKDINLKFRRVKIVSTRLPRLKSDQTNSIFQAKAGENMTALLSTARQMHAV